MTSKMSRRVKLLKDELIHRQSFALLLSVTLQRNFQKQKNSPGDITRTADTADTALRSLMLKAATFKAF